MEMLQGVWKQHLRPHTVVGYGVKMFLPSPPNYVIRSPGRCLTPYQEMYFSTSTSASVNFRKGHQFHSFFGKCDLHKKRFEGSEGVIHKI